jgi:hypothetical protein
MVGAGAMDQEIGRRNGLSLGHLRAVAARLFQDEFLLPIGPPWTAAALFAHVAFWERVRLDVNDEPPGRVGRSVSTAQPQIAGSPCRNSANARRSPIWSLPPKQSQSSKRSIELCWRRSPRNWSRTLTRRLGMEKAQLPDASCLQKANCRGRQLVPAAIPVKASFGPARYDRRPTGPSTAPCWSRWPPTWWSLCAGPSGRDDNGEPPFT